MSFVYTVVAAVAAYLIGSINSSIIISKLVTGEDIRKSGSGNAGATNMLRTMGKKYGALTLVIDVLKGVIAILLAMGLKKAGAVQNAEYIAGVCVVLGHNFPIFFDFKGGKGVATSLGVVLMLDWKIGLIVLGAAILIMALTRYVSLGSICAALLFMAIHTITMITGKEFDAVRFVCIMILGVLLILRHSANIKRLAKGEENKLGEKKKEA